VNAEVVASARKKFADKKDSWTEAQLKDWPVISGSAQLSPSTQTSTEWTPISAGMLALSSNLNSTAVTLAGGVEVGEYPVLTRTTMVLPGGAIFTGTPNALGSLMPGSLLLGSTTAVNFLPVISTVGAITSSASNGLILTGTNATSYVTAGLVNSTLVTYPSFSSSIGIGTLSISSRITTSGGTLVFGGSSAGTGN
jgi:hypothetical protein